MNGADSHCEDPARWQALRIRQALTRAGFAASQLAREVRGERERAWVAGIRDAVDELEREWAVTAPWPLGARGILSETLRVFEERWSAVLRDTGVKLEVDPEGAERLSADPWLVRRAGLALLRIGRLSLGGAGRLILRARTTAECTGFGLEISWEGAAVTTIRSVPNDALREVCIAGGAFVERSATSVCLWFPAREDASCATR